MFKKISVLFASLILISASQIKADQLEDNFKVPPDSAKPKTWWHWMQGCVSKEGITADLEAYKSAGLGGAILFHVGQLPIDGWVKFQSEQWWELMKFAASETDRLGLELGFHNCPGWSSSGGPWIKPEKSMQKVIWCEVDFNGPGTFDANLAKPANINWNFYVDIATLAIPYEKNLVKVSEIIDLTAGVEPNGRLKWDAPEGKWKIIRFGRTTTGKGCNPAPPGAWGLECDKLDKAGADAHFDGYVAKVLENAGPALGKSFKGVLIDSYEAEDQNWSPSFREEFKNRRGYDPVPWLATLARKVVESTDETARFRYDWKRTIAELFADNYYGQMANRVHQYPGLKIGIEPYFGPFDTMKVGTIGDEVAAEFWQSPAPWGWETLKPVASGAHIAGIRIIGAEAFTGQPQNAKWQQDPYSLKVTGDRAFCLGINQLILHTSAHQPWLNARPGMTMGFWGTHFGRTQTWWGQANAWLNYLARCQYLLQEGSFACDICFLGEGGGPSVPRIPSGYDGDIVSEEYLLKYMKVQDGNLILPSGMKYRLLVLPNRNTMLPAVARKIRELVNAGAVIIGPKPATSPSLQDYPACDKEIQTIAAEIWDANKVISKKSVESVLQSMNIKPDFKADAGKILWIHRRIGQADIYFVSNQDSNERIAECTFRIEGRIPELWDAASGEIREAKKFSTADGLTTLPLKFDPRGSVFIVFRKAGKSRQEGNNWDDFKTVEEITGDWLVEFDPCWGGPAQVTFEKLADWTKRPEEGIKYYSGTAVYQKEIELPKIKNGERLFVDLGEVKNLAEVRVNGQKMGIAWKPPYRVEITKAAQPGKNKIEIAVTNLWPNRLIGDEQQPDDCVWDSEQFWDQTVARTSVGRPLKIIPDWMTEHKPRPSAGRYTFTSWKFYNKDSPLLESGLLGPMKIVSVN